MASDTNLGALGYQSVNGASTGTRQYNDVVGTDRTTYEYRVYAVNTVGDTWNYADPNLNRITPVGSRR